MTTIAKLSASVLIFLGALFSPQIAIAPQSLSLGATDFRPVQAQPFTLSGSGVVQGATTMVLRRFQDIDGNNLTMSSFGLKGYGTVEPGNGTREESILFTGVTQNTNGTATLTGVLHVGFSYPYTQTSGFTKSHAGATTFVLSNTSAYYSNFLSKENDATTSPNARFAFSSTTPPQYDLVPFNHNSGLLVATTAEFASLAYVNAVSASGCAAASEGVKGCVDLATQTQAASSTSLGSSGARLVLPATIATDTPNSATRTSRVLMSSMFGYLKQSWIDLTQEFAFTAATFTRATSTQATTTSFAVSGATTNFNGARYTWPTSNGAASSSIFKLGSNGTIVLDYAGTRMKSFLPTPFYATTTEIAQTGRSSNTTGFTSLFNLPEAMLINKITIRPSSCSTPGSFKLGIYSEDGSTLLISTTTKTLTAQIQDTSTLTTPTLLDQGNYYFVLVPNGVVNCGFFEWKADSDSFYTGVSGEPVYVGTQAVSASTLPSSFVTSTLSYTGFGGITFRLDD